ncbi:multiple epidermal growth factor-like domains protein 10 [Folsomia candida]|uniref:multiple epidermal growth factor-like domains protein 10 n=1 Tax=Folsomia candida TaxID=158441 RepID=UPI000B8EFB8A|nr:multiple epidermal growth factor-like domains protein 10 [Folsomia candida]
MSLNRILITVFVIIATANFCISYNGRGQTRSLFGERCNKTQRCKSQSWLVCDTYDGNVCRCTRPDEMVYEPAKEKCVALIGEKCMLDFDQEEYGYATVRSERVECVTQGECDSATRLCKCPSEYYPDPDGTACYRLKMYKSPCENTYECSENFVCNNGTCSCNSDTEVYNEESFGTYVSNRGHVYVPRNRCIKKVGEICADHHYESSSLKYCVRNAKCSGTCICADGYSRTSSNICGIGHGASCTDRQSTCSDVLQCSDGVCKCPNPDFETYDSTVQLCRTNLREHCDENKTYSCVQGAECMYDQDQDDFHCNCEEGSVQVDATTCQKEYGQSCQYGSSEPQSRCDSISNLVCKMGKCQCKNSADIYEPERGQCSTPVGFSCEEHTKGEHTKCVRNAYCTKSFPTDRGDFGGRCKCLDGFEKTQNRTCIKPSTTFPILSPTLQTTFQPDVKVGKDIEVAPTTQENLKDEPTV